ncbi:MAG: baseplate J/gp47 family protein [Oscillospiraceae bacterium]|nr:baseplate J/gp47 family protein [Oscillospiraceae bacterium]
MIIPYVQPEFLQNQSVDEIHGRMMDVMPNGIDKSENQIPWDFTRPSAIEKAHFVQFQLNETIQIAFPQWAYGRWLDYHAELQGLSRRAANSATGFLKVTGKSGIKVSQGFQFATPANLTPSVIFETTCEIEFEGVQDHAGNVTLDIPIKAVNGGIDGNVPPDTIILMVKPESGISYVSNVLATTGGTAEETDDDLRLRILDVAQRGESFTGCDADYVRWAREIAGVGNVIVNAEWNGPGTVRIFVIDSNGQPANRAILDAVYEHIIRPDNRMERLAPIGATLTVSAPAPLYIDVFAVVTLVDGENMALVRDRFKANLDKYWLQATTENALIEVQNGSLYNAVKYVFVGSTLAQTAGVANYSDLSVNTGLTDIIIPIGQFPVTREVMLIDN